MNLINLNTDGAKSEKNPIVKLKVKEYVSYVVLKRIF